MSIGGKEFHRRTILESRNACDGCLVPRVALILRKSRSGVATAEGYIVQDVEGSGWLFDGLNKKAYVI